MHAVDGNGPARRQRHPLRADRFALVRQPGDAEEHVGAVGGANASGFVRMRGHPVAHALRRYLLARNEIALDERARDRAEGITVVRIVADAQRRAVLEDHAPGALDLDAEQVERILEPADLELLPVERAGLDGAAVVVRHQLVVFVAATDPRALVRKCERAGLVAVGDEVARPPIERDGEFGAGKARARDDRLEIAGQESGGLAKPRDTDGLKILFEEDAGGIRILRPQAYRLAADVPQGFGDCCAIVGATCLAQGLTTRLVGGEGGEVIVGRPARELAPFERLELAACELHRPFGRCGGGRQTYDCAEEACDHATLGGLAKRPTRLHASKCTAGRNGSAARTRPAWPYHHPTG